MSAWGLTDSNYTGRRFTHRYYDDCVNEHSITSPQMVQKVNEAWDLSLDTGMPGTKDDYSGTFYGYGDTYHYIASKGVPVRLFPCYEIDYSKSQFDANGLPLKLAYFRDKPQLYSKEYFLEKEKKKSPKIFGSQFLTNPTASSAHTFDVDDLRYYSEDPVSVRKGKTVILLIDPASERLKGRSFFSMWAIALGKDQNYYVIDAVYDKLNLVQRTNVLFDFRRRWSPFEVRYEHNAFQADIEHIKYVMEKESFRFDIVEVGGQVPKNSRIERLLPIFRAHRMYFPITLMYQPVDGSDMIDVVEVFKSREYIPYPETVMLDMLDSMSRIAEPDLPLRWPQAGDYWDQANSDPWRRKIRAQRKAVESAGRTWMSQ